MKLVAICPCRNEGWIAGLTFRALLLWVDALIVLDHASDPPVASSDFWDAADSHRVTVLRDSDGVWQEMNHRQLLLEAARAQGATHIVTIDADELLSSNHLTSIRRYFEKMPGNSTFSLPWLQCHNGISYIHVDGLWSRQFASAGFVDSPSYNWKPAEDGYQHHHREPYGMGPSYIYRPIQWGIGGLFHFQMANERRLRAKQYLYCLHERLRWPHRKSSEQVRQQYSPTVYGGVCPPEPPKTPWYPNHNLAKVPDQWLDAYQPLMRYVDLEAEPWQEREIRRLLAERPDLASGLDDFGVRV